MVDFFGRERRVQVLLSLLSEHHFVCVHGTSGSGKSSLIEAGLVATLEREHRRLGVRWRFATFRPGTTPIWNLARALGSALNGSDDEDGPEFADKVMALYGYLTRPGGSIARAAIDGGLHYDENLLLVADQFEEIFRFHCDGNDAELKSFIGLILAVFDQQPQGIYLTLALRTDFLADCGALPGLAEAVSSASYLTPALTDAELRAAIDGPAELYGGRIEPPLMERMLAESALAEADRLPLLQHRLMRCWQKATSTHHTTGSVVVTEAIYDDPAIAGVANALDRHADEVISSPEQKGRLSEIALAFRALTEIDRDKTVLRRALPWRQLLDETGVEPKRMEPVVRTFAAMDCGFLGRPLSGEPLRDDTIVDVAHEAILRHWGSLWDRGPQLGWLHQETEDAVASASPSRASLAARKSVRSSSHASPVSVENRTS